MKNVRSITISALNVAMHNPHSPDLYVELLKSAKRLNSVISLGALHSAMLGSLEIPSEYKKGMVLTGEIYRFVKIDSSEPWFNLKTSEAASDDDMNAVSIPNHLLPHLQTISFVFRPDNHQLWFISHDRKDQMGAKAATTFFQRLFDLVQKKNLCTQVEVTAMPDSSTIEAMLSLYHLDRITIDLKRPNADDGVSDEARFLEKLERQGVRDQQTTLLAASGESIKPDAETIALANVAAENGRVSVVGKNSSGTRVKESTVERPLSLSCSVNSLIETSMDVLRRTSLAK